VRSRLVFGIPLLASSAVVDTIAATGAASMKLQLDVTSPASRHPDVPKSGDIIGGHYAHGGHCTLNIFTLAAGPLSNVSEEGASLISCNPY
jgi:hypothetical protein